MDEIYIIMHMQGICSITKQAFPPKSTPVTWDPPPHGFPSPRIKYHMVKVPHLWDFSPPPPPPSQTKSHMLSQYYIWNWCWRRFAIDGEGLLYGIIPPWGSSAIGILPGGGGGDVYRMVLFPPGAVLWDFFRGRFSKWYNFRGDNLPWYLLPYHEICVGGGKIYHRGGSFTIWYCSPPPPPGSSAMGFIPGEGLPYGIPTGGKFAIWYNFRGGGG